MDGQEILCFMCKGSQPVDAQKAKLNMLAAVTLPHTELSTSPVKQIFPIDIAQGLRVHPWVHLKSQNTLTNFLAET